MPSDHTRGYSNHSNRSEPIEAVYNTPTTPTHMYGNVVIDDNESLYDCASYGTRQAPSYTSRDYGNIINPSPNANMHSNHSYVRNESPTHHGDQNLGKTSVVDAGYMVILPDGSTGDEIVTKMCVAYCYENDRD